MSAFLFWIVALVVFGLIFMIFEFINYFFIW
jgi:hypothetical protein